MCYDWIIPQRSKGWEKMSNGWKHLSRSAEKFRKPLMILNLLRKILFFLNFTLDSHKDHAGVDPFCWKKKRGELCLRSFQSYFVCFFLSIHMTNSLSRLVTSTTFWERKTEEAGYSYVWGPRFTLSVYWLSFSLRAIWYLYFSCEMIIYIQNASKVVFFFSYIYLPWFLSN